MSTLGSLRFVPSYRERGMQFSHLPVVGVFNRCRARSNALEVAVVWLSYWVLSEDVWSATPVSIAAINGYLYIGLRIDVDQ